MTKRQELRKDKVDVKTTRRDKMKLKSVHQGDRVMPLGKPRYKVRKGPIWSSPGADGE